MIDPTKEPSRISGMFDAIAGRYDLLNRLLSAGMDRRWRQHAVNALDLTGRQTVLDLCTGTADLALAAAASGGARRIIGIDFSGAMLLLGKEKVRRSGANGVIDLIRGDISHLPVADASIDAITIGFGIRNVERPSVACREMARVLRGGGTAVILEFSLPSSGAIRAIYLWYFRHVLPFIGRVISRHPTAYTYLPVSVEAFPSPEAFARLLRECGFSAVRTIALTFGVVYLFVATRASAGASSA